MGEELPGLDLGHFRMDDIVEFPQQINYLFWTRIDVSEEVLNSILCEGQRAAWMTQAQVRKTKVAFDFGTVVERFFESRACSVEKAEWRFTASLEGSRV